MSSTPNLHTLTPITLPSKDGYPIAATHYRTTLRPKGNILLAGATGVQQRFYRRFAEYACQQGYHVLTLDYRGVGQSRPATLKGFEMSYLDWGFLDLNAALDYLYAEALPLYWLGHSFGGHGLGLVDHPERLRAAYCFGTGAGWAGWMKTTEALKVRLLWTCVLPLIVWRKGYMAWSLLGLGDDLPLGVYQDWKRWCRHRHYFFDDPHMQATAQRYANVRVPCVFANATDDLWAPPRSREAFIQGYRHMPRQSFDLHPAQLGQPIGHMGYFRPGSEALWANLLDWFAQHASTEQAAVQQVRQ